MDDRVVALAIVISGKQQHDVVRGPCELLHRKLQEEEKINSYFQHRDATVMDAVKNVSPSIKFAALCPPAALRSARLAQEAEGAGGRLVVDNFKPMRDAAEYRKRAEDCRQQALKLATQPDHWGALVEMAQTWEQLADLHELSERLKASGVLLTKPAISAE